MARTLGAFEFLTVALSALSLADSNVLADDKLLFRVGPTENDMFIATLIGGQVAEKILARLKDEIRSPEIVA